MRHRKLGGLDVSVVGVGCNQFGGRVDDAGTNAIVDAAIESGITFFDTADRYHLGASELALGKALKGRRDSVVLATKWGRTLEDGQERRGRSEYLRWAIEESLRRLDTDYVDLYQHHEEDPDTPLEETFGTLRELVDEGKIRLVGTSNYSPLSLERAHAIAAALDLPYVSEQSDWSLLQRGVEEELVPTCARLGLGFIPFYPLASGLLSGTISRESPPSEGTRLFGREIDSATIDTVERLRGWAADRGVTLLDVAIGYLAAQEIVVSVIAGASKPEQVRANGAAGSWEPSPAELAELDALTAEESSKAAPRP